MRQPNRTFHLLNRESRPIYIHSKTWFWNEPQDIHFSFKLACQWVKKNFAPQTHASCWISHGAFIIRLDFLSRQSTVDSQRWTPAGDNVKGFGMYLSSRQQAATKSERRTRASQTSNCWTIIAGRGQHELVDDPQVVSFATATASASASALTTTEMSTKKVRAAALKFASKQVQLNGKERLR